MTNLDSILKSRDITLPTKVPVVKAMVFPVVMYECESWTIKRAQHWRIEAFEWWCWRRFLRVPWTRKRSNQSVLKEISPEWTEAPIPPDAIQPSHPLLSLFLLLLIFVSIRVFSNESVFHIRWSKYWTFSFSISPSNEYSGLISFRMDWLDLLVVQGTLKSLFQHHNSKASILWRSAFFMVQL